MATVKIFPRVSKKNTADLVPLVIRITHNRKTKFMNLGVLIDVKYWNSQTNKMKPGAPNSARINNLIAQKEAEIQSTILDSSLKEERVEVGELKKRIKGGATDDFFQYAEQVIQKIKRENRVNSYKREKSIVDKFREFNGNDHCRFDQITVTKLHGFESYLRSEKNNKINTIHSNMRVLRKIIRSAVREGIISMEMNPFGRYQLKLEKSKKEYLLDDDLCKLEELKLPGGSILDTHRNLYVFSAYAGGIRISDLLMLRWKDLRDGKITFQVKKTKEQVGIMLPRKAVNIIESLKKRLMAKDGKINPNGFIFPLLKMDPSSNDPWVIQRTISAATAYANKNLKLLANQAGIDKKISFHTARHSFAVRALQKGMRIEYVSKLMAHSSVKQTEGYAKIINEELDNAIMVFND